MLRCEIKTLDFLVEQTLPGHQRTSPLACPVQVSSPVQGIPANTSLLLALNQALFEVLYMH